MVSDIDTAKRALVTLLKSLAGIYHLVVGLTRDSTDTQACTAYKKVSRKTDPAHGGTDEHHKALNAARDLWEEALRARKATASLHFLVGESQPNKSVHTSVFVG